VKSSVAGLLRKRKRRILRRVNSGPVPEQEHPVPSANNSAASRCQTGFSRLRGVKLGFWFPFLDNFAHARQGVAAFRWP
jgi:hypothetical protein